MPRWKRWTKCSLCKQDYHGIVRCALGWACWKTYVGLPETEWARRSAMTDLGNGLSCAGRNMDALSVREAELSMERRLGASEQAIRFKPSAILVTQNNLAGTYYRLGRFAEALPMYRDVYSGSLKLFGEEHENTLTSAANYAVSLRDLKRFEEAKALLREVIPVARRVLGEDNELTLKMRKGYADALYSDTGATLDDLREAVTTLEETARTSRRVLGGAHPMTGAVESNLREARAALRARETPPRSA